LKAFANDLFIAGLAGQQLRRVRFSPADATRVDSTESLLAGEYGRFSDVIVGPDGAIYLATSNRGLSSAAADDDRLLRLTAR
jgi:glucose/arabinose dehydrogenase